MEKDDEIGRPQVNVTRPSEEEESLPGLVLGSAVVSGGTNFRTGESRALGSIAGGGSPAVTLSSLEEQNEDWRSPFWYSKCMDDKIDDVCELMKDRRLDILCVNETKRKDISKPFEKGEELWIDVKDIIVKCDINERIVILGDFNRWVDVKQHGYDRVLGYICLEKRKRQKYNILYVSVDDRVRRKVVDMKVYRGINVGTDHFLYEWLELDELWKVMKSILVDEAKKACGVNKRTNVSKKDNKWRNLEVRKVISEKKKAWLDLQSAKANHRV
ncbi:hypothetical protein EVAR_100262_1 [Eumeta japonica]|uniref:Endonuclease/exonuclease/phosphatase domain-containing protein n=1 Tax=Eumeta variegata TaxID=151549 RepID=A0A4C1ZW31_EUMVA|nr:hypothetical protein EVAR_100262_1 [Eumeta japonica]